MKTQQQKKFLYISIIFAIAVVFIISILIYKNYTHSNNTLINDDKEVENINNINNVLMGINSIKEHIDKTSATSVEVSEITPTTNSVIINTTTTRKSMNDISKTTTTTQKDNVIKEKSNYTNKNVPKSNTIKSYMNYKAITSKSSRQYKLQYSLAYTGDNGLRMVNGRYCIALGSYYTTTIGQYVDIELANGKIIKGILSDCKANQDTDAMNRIHTDGSVVEFLVDTKSLNKTVKKMGDVSYINGWNSKVVNIKVYDKVVKF